MGRLLTLIVLAVCAFSAAGAPRDAVPGSFLVLCYHEVRDDVREVADPYAVDTAELASQCAWLRAHGYRPVSLDDVLAARRGERALPEKVEDQSTPVCKKQCGRGFEVLRFTFLCWDEEAVPVCPRELHR